MKAIKNYFLGEKTQEYCIEPKDLSSYLDYQSFNEKNNIFSLKNGASAILIEIFPVGLKESSFSDLDLEIFLEKLQVDTDLQVIVVASNKMPASSKSSCLSQRANAFDPKIGIPRNYRFFVCISMQSIDDEGLLKLQKWLQKVQSFAFKVLDADGLINFTQELGALKLGSYQEKKYDKDKPLAEQMVEVNDGFKICEGQIIQGDIVNRIYEVADFPDKVAFGEMINLLEASKNISGRFVINFGFTKNIDEIKASKLLIQGRDKIKKAEMFWNKNNTKVQHEADKWRKTINRIKSGQSLMNISMQIVLSSHADLIGEASSSLIKAYEQNKFRLQLVSNVTLAHLFGNFPAGQYFKNTKRDQLMHVRNTAAVVSLLPVHGEWKGEAENGMTFIGRTGQVVFWNPFYGKNHHVITIAKSNLQRTVLLRRLVLGMLELDTQVVILNLGDEMQSFCSKVIKSDFSQDMVNFIKASSVSINPFAQVKDADFLDNKEDWIFGYTNIIDALDVIQSLAGEPMERNHIKREVLAKAIKRCMFEFQSYDFSITDVISSLQHLINEKAEEIEAISNLLKNHDMGPNLTSEFLSKQHQKVKDRQIIEEIVQSLAKWDSKLSNEGKRDIVFDKKITICDFDDVKETNQIVAVAQMLIRELYLKSLRENAKSKFMIIACTKMLEHCAEFLNFVRGTIRLHGGSLVICAKDLSEFEKSRAHESLLNEATWVLEAGEDVNFIRPICQKYTLGNI
jgi:hypothetical protein